MSQSIKGTTVDGGAAPLRAGPAELRHLAGLLEDATDAERGVAHGRPRRRGLAHPSARSLLFTVLGEHVLPSDREVWSGALVAALGALDVDERTARQAIARTGAAGWLTGRRVGRRAAWTLTPSARDLLGRGAERIYGFGTPPAAWDGHWLLLRISVPGKLRDKLRTQLAWASFGSLGQGFWVSPHVHREAEAVRVVENLGLRLATTSFVARLGAVGDDRELAREAWDLSALADRYRTFLGAFEAVRPATPEATFAALTRMVHEWRRFPFADPGLPGRLLPDGWVGDRARQVFVRRRETWRPVATRWFQAQSRD